MSVQRCPVRGFRGLPGIIDGIGAGRTGSTLERFRRVRSRPQPIETRWATRTWLATLALLLIAIGATLPAISTVAQSEQPLVVVGEIDGTITPVMARYVENTIERAERDGAAAVVFEMDTPGGLSSAMDDIIDDFRQSEVPIVVYVAPSGARAASAGVFITYAAQIAAMAPGTNIGSASPVFLGADGSTSDVDDTMTAKVTNDAVARIRNLAAQFGRNADWAESAVRDAANITADEALQLGVIEYIAPDLATLLNEIDGATVELAAGPVTLTTANARTTELDMSWFERLLQFLSNPTIGYIFLSLGNAWAVLRVREPRRDGARHRRRYRHTYRPGVAGVYAAQLGRSGLDGVGVCSLRGRYLPPVGGIAHCRWNCCIYLRIVHAYRRGHSRIRALAIGRLDHRVVSGMPSSF